ncbi:thyrostimulin beta-5 subunit [Trichonephila inaurata madagascariensis]|uniref:Thyrostimulin beta-5 subunit n=1 Tax=Trichonephila inaurata madagascariensis TaxID=2747483 RepID=A0A8X6YIK1_9ARAC|nr:thyrostimulin beta-5 subunit [Trichonephila inaurata madagascariensis]
MLIQYSERLVCAAVFIVIIQADQSIDTSFKNVLQCLRREYTLKATQSDDYGRRCWDVIRTTSCWGRCDSFEIPDWRFPYKISIHPVCMHDQKILRKVRLRHCDPPDTDDDLRIYEYYDAITCSCGVCNSSDTFCDWKGHSSSQKSTHNRDN